ncbi:MAG: type II toxin-antitoxin system VapC family toxin [Chloroflexi bacterium]|nr:type II toxin-antitoxin system VapC family toxin [Chloroflexota bacterium]
MNERKVLVLDASVALAVIRSEPSGAAAATLISRHRSAAGRLIVPDQFWLELANVLSRRYGASPEQVVEAFQAMDDLEIETVQMDRPLLLLALDVQHRSGLSAYDAIDLALAEAEDCGLLTLDAHLGAAAGARLVAIEGSDRHRLAEAPAAYGGKGIDWARFGPYLASLRAEFGPQFD